MVCFSPLRGVRSPDGELLFRWSYQRGVAHFGSAEEFTFSCGKCVGCCLRRSRDLAVRCIHQSRTVDESTCHFLTFTHSDASLPRLDDGRPTLDKTLMPAMFKRLRKNTGVEGIKYLQVGEYGTQSLRPHYHAVVFGLPLSDLRPYKRGRFGHQLYNSQTLQDAWQDRGHVVVGGFSFDTAQYCARYMLDKKLHADYTSSESVNLLTGEVLSPQIEHISMSRGGRSGHGLAYDFFEEHHRRFFALGSCVVGNKQYPIPRYYLDQMQNFIDRAYMSVDLPLARDLEHVYADYSNQMFDKFSTLDPMDDSQLLLACRAKEQYIKEHVRDVVSLCKI